MTTMHFPEERGRPAPDPADVERQRKEQQRRVQLLLMGERSLLRLYAQRSREVGRSPVDEPMTRGDLVRVILLLEHEAEQAEQG